MIKRILFPTDYSPSSNAALRCTVSVARMSDATLLVLHVEAPRSTYGSVPPPEDDMADEEAGLLTLLATTTAGHHKVLPHEFRTVKGNAADEIIRAAGEEQVDLIVMATSGRGGLRRVLLGSVAEAVLRRAPCPVLTLNEPSAGNPGGR